MSATCVRMMIPNKERDGGLHRSPSSNHLVLKRGAMKRLASLTSLCRSVLNRRNPLTTRTSYQRDRSQPLGLEALEDRTLLSGTTQLIAPIPSNDVQPTDGPCRSYCSR